MKYSFVLLTVMLTNYMLIHRDLKRSNNTMETIVQQFICQFP